jgi:uncharacterized membrane protein
MTEVTLAEYAYDLAALVLAISMIAGYHFYLRNLARRNSAAVLTSAAALARITWVETVMSDLNNAILGVQTLRSSIMAASFLASTAILLMVGALTLTGEAKALQATWHLLNLFGAPASGLWLIKLLCILLLLFFAFFNFINAIRIFNNVGYMVSIHKGPGKDLFSPEMVASELNRGGVYFSVGVRAYYYLVPLIFWLFGPIYMVGSTILLVFVLLPKIDRTPPQFEQGLSEKK